MPPAWTLFCCFSLSAIAVSALLALFGWECARFVRSRLGCDLFNPAKGAPTHGRVALIAPCKGTDPDLTDNLSRLFDQDHGFYAVYFVVERPDDPAVPVIRRLIDENRHISAHVFVAGEAHESGQKVHNLCELIQRLSPRFEILAFTDSDARHNGHWLRSLTTHLYTPGVGAATGYRWLTPRRLTFSNLALYSANSAVAGLFGRGSTNFIWGGSWAIRRDVFERLRLLDAWRGTLSDDLVARRVVRRAGLRVEFEPRCLAATPVDTTWSEALEFLRRQLLIGRRYAPGYWAAAMLGVTVVQGAFWANLAASLWGAAAGWAHWPATTAAAAALYALGALRGWLRQRSARRMLGEQSQPHWAARLFDICCGPLAGLVFWGAMVGSLLGDAITWRGKRYRILPGGRIERLDDSQRPASRPATETPVFRRAA